MCIEFYIYIFTLILPGVCYTHMAEELIGQAQIVVQGQDCDSLKTNHNDLKKHRGKVIIYEYKCLFPNVYSVRPVRWGNICIQKQIQKTTQLT